MKVICNIAGFGLVAILIVAMVFPVSINAKTLEELRIELNAKRKELQKSNAQIKKYKEEIQLKKREARTLKDQISLIDGSVKEVTLTLNRTLAEIEKTLLEIDTVNEEIKEREAEIDVQRTRLGEYIRKINILDQQSSVTVFLKYKTFSEAVNEASTFQELRNRGQETLVSIQELKKELENQKSDLENFQQTLEALKTRQENEQISLNTQKQSKDRILKLTNSKEREYQALLKQSMFAHKQAQSEISNLDTSIREQLKKQGIKKLPSIGILDWPIPINFGISCEFHCSGYPYAYLIGPHTGIDIPANVGTPIKAATDGYVARVRNVKSPRAYNYLMLIHGDNISTIYGHMSGFAVKEGQMVSRGTVIGYTGGAPGMNGSGLSSGPHLHFEVRLNNVPVNPRNYL